MQQGSNARFRNRDDRDLPWKIRGLSMKWRSLEESRPGADTRSLQEILAERKQLAARYVPPETQAVQARVIAELKGKRLAERILSPGSLAPSFVLVDHTGSQVSSYDHTSRGRLVICFFRGRWCPFCVGQLEALNLVLPQIERAGASLLAISPQTVQQSFFMADQHKLRFRLLRDAGNSLARQFGLVYLVPDEQQAIYRRAFINLPFANGEPSWELPIPATFILERDGTVLYAQANEDCAERPEPSDILLQLLQPPG
jgi:peroxiredoxin